METIKEYIIDEYSKLALWRESNAHFHGFKKSNVYQVTFLTAGSEPDSWYMNMTETYTGYEYDLALKAFNERLTNPASYSCYARRLDEVLEQE